MTDSVTVAIVRPDANVAAKGFYNSQEIGLAMGLSTLGVSTDIYIAGESENTSIYAEGSGWAVRVIELPFYKIPEIDHAIYPRLLDRLRNETYQLVQVNEENELTCFRVARFCYKNNIPVIVYQGMYKGIGGRIRTAFQKAYNLLLRPLMQGYLSMAAAKTSAAANYLKEGGYTSVEVIPVGLDVGPFENAELIDWHANLNISPETQVVLYVGVLEKRRNIDMILDMAKALAEKDVVFLIVGSGEEEDASVSKISQDNITNVRLLGRIPQKELPSLYSLADVSLLASDYEIYGMTVIESMYFGTPVLSTKTAGPVDIIDNDINGVLLDGTNLNDWVEHLSALLDDGVRLSAMSGAAKSKVEEALLWEKVAQRYMAKIIEPCNS